MSTTPIDYEALAKQHGALNSTKGNMDYTALAKQHGAVSSVAPIPRQNPTASSLPKVQIPTPPGLEPYNYTSPSGVKMYLTPDKLQQEAQWKASWDAQEKEIESRTPAQQAFAISRDTLPVVGSHLATGEKAIKSFKQGDVSQGLGYTGATALPIFGPPAAGVGEKLGNKDVIGAVGDVADVAATTYAAGFMGPHTGATPIAGQKVINKPRQASTAALIKATNPDASDLGYVNANGGGKGFNGNVENIHDLHVDYARKNGIPEKVAAAKTPGQALEIAAQGPRGAAESLPFFQQVMKPNLGELGETPNGYGGTRQDYNHATLQQLSDRLTAINGELHPKYQKGGSGSSASQASLNAERSQQLQAEASGIRNSINQTLSRKTGIPVEQLEPLRAQYGQLKDVADTMQYRANEIQHAEATTGNKTYAEKVPSHLSVPAIVVKGGAKVVDKFAGHPVINGLKKVYDYEPNSPTSLKIQPPMPPVRYETPQGTPFGKPGERSPLPTASLPTPAKEAVAAQQQQLQTRQQLVAQRRAEQAARYSAHGQGIQTPQAPVVEQGNITKGHVAQEQAFFNQAKQELGQNAPISNVLRRAQELKQQAQLTTLDKSAVAEQQQKLAVRRQDVAQRKFTQTLTSQQRDAAVGTVMNALKRGVITQQEADSKIQRLRGGGSGKLIRMPQEP